MTLDDEGDSLKGFLHNGAVVSKAPRHKATKNKVKGLRPCPILFQVIDLIPVSFASSNGSYLNYLEVAIWWYASPRVSSCARTQGPEGCSHTTRVERETGQPR